MWWDGGVSSRRSERKSVEAVSARGQPCLRGGHEFLQNPVQVVLQFPHRKVRPQLRQIRDITDMISGPVLLLVLPLQLITGLL